MEKEALLRSSAELSPVASVYDLDQTVYSPSVYTPNISPPQSPIITNHNVPLLFLSGAESNLDYKPLPPLPSPIYSPTPQQSTFFPSTPSQDPSYLNSSYLPQESPSPSSSSSFLPFKPYSPSSYDRYHKNLEAFSTSSEERRLKVLDEAELFRIRRARNKRLIGVIMCLVLLLLSLAIGLAVVGVVMGWGQGSACVKWSDGSMSGNCENA